MRSHQKYSHESFQQAISGCANGSMTSVEAAERLGVPKSSTRNRQRSLLMKVGSDRSHTIEEIDENYPVQLSLNLERMVVDYRK